MSDARVHRMTHHTEVDAPAGVIYGLIADALRWPVFFPPNVHVEQLEFDGTRERLRMWVTAGGEIKSWTTLRSLDPVRRRIAFRQEVPAEPTTSMGGSWTVEALGPERARLTVDNDFTVADDRPEDVAWLERVTTANSHAGLAGIKQLAERWHRLDDLVLSFEESLRVKGPGELVYDFLYRLGEWDVPVVPEVSRLDVRDYRAGIQLMTVDTRGADGRTDTTEWVRIGFPHAGRIVYKRTSPPARPDLVAAHAGEWSVDPDESGVVVTVRHHVVLDEAAVRQAFGEEGGTVRAAREVRERIGRESAVTLALAKRHAESAVRVL